MRDSRGTARITARITARLTAVAAGVCGLLVLTMGPVYAACHAFTVEADPAEPAEADTVTLTIRRDAAVQPSSVRVRTVDETAAGGSDYTPLDERVQFSDETEQTRQVDIVDDDTSEDSETFVVELSEGEGCEVNQNFTYDSATVAIQDDDAPGQETPTDRQSPGEDEAPAQDQDGQEDPGRDESAGGDIPETGAGVLAGLGLLGVLAAAAGVRATSSR